MEPLNVKPTYNNVIVEPIEEKKTTDSGLIVKTNSNSAKTRYGYVVALGDGKTIGSNSTVLEFAVKIGDKVLYDASAGTSTKIDHRDVVILTENDILAIED